MENLASWLLPPLVGAIIGYFTNWLAIKMLFRPLAPVRIFGWRLPFTPGVIPARRDELAAKIGETVSLYLINESELNRVLQEPRVRAELATHLESGWQRWIAQEQSLQQLLDERDDFPVESITASLSVMLAQLVLQQARTPGTQEQIMGGITWLVEQICEHPLSAESSGKIASALADYLQALCADPEQMQHLEQHLEQGLTSLAANLTTSEVTLRQLLGEEAEVALCRVVATLEPKVATVAESFLQQDNLASQLTQQVQEWLGKQVFLGMLGSLISRERWESLVQKLLQEAGEYLSREENRTVISQQILAFLEERLDDPLSLWANRLGEEKLLSVLRQLQSRLLNELTKEQTQLWLRGQIENIVNKAQNRSLRSFGESWGFSETLDLLPERIWQQLEVYLLAEDTERLLAQQILRLLHNSLQQPIRDSLGAVKIPQNTFEMLSGLLLSAGAGQAATLLQTLDISLMVRRRLSEFPIQEIEKLTLDIAGRELSTITNLGGLLGAIIGLTQLLFR